MRVLLAGATGLVGQSVLRQALADGRFDGIVAPTRRPLPPAPKLQNPIVDLNDLPAEAPWWTVDAVICALGATMRRAGSQSAFRKVDHDAVLSIARLARAHGAHTFALTSAMGADPHSRIFYSRTKGETEASVAGCGFPSLTIVRPGLIGGVRDEFRPAEFVAMKFLRAFGPVLPRRYRINPADNIARALLNAAARAQRGHHIIRSEQLV